MENTQKQDSPPVSDLFDHLETIPLVWFNAALIGSFLFYFILSNVAHVIADLYYSPSFTQQLPSDIVQLQRWIFQPLAETIYPVIQPILNWWSIRHEQCILVMPNHVEALRAFRSKRHEIIQCWIMSFVHALGTALIFAWAWFPNTESIEEKEERVKLMFMHTGGYFLADTIVNPSVMFALHHLCPLPFLHILIVNSCPLFSAALSLGFAEDGNTVAHAMTLWTCKTGTRFQVIRALSFWISRPISMTYAFLSWAYDIPDEYHGTWKGKLCFCMFLAVAGINFGWMLVMIAPQRVRDAAIRMVNGTSTVKMD